jgi:hypothetical protein
LTSSASVGLISPGFPHLLESRIAGPFSGSGELPLPMYSVEEIFVRRFSDLALVPLGVVIFVAFLVRFCSKFTLETFGDFLNL